MAITVAKNQSIRQLLDKIKIVRLNEQENIALVGPIRLPIQLGEQEAIFQWYVWMNINQLPENPEELLMALPTAHLAEQQQSSVLVYGDFEKNPEAIIRFHSICHTGDIFGSKRCDCGYQLEKSLHMIMEYGCGAVFYIANHEGRGIGLFSKALAYILQENGMDTVDANHHVGFPDDIRSYDEAIAVFKTLRNKPAMLITNNPKKLDALKRAGAPIYGRMPLWGGDTEYNQKYLQTKIKRSGHLKSE